MSNARLVFLAASAIAIASTLHCSGDDSATRATGPVDSGVHEGPDARAHVDSGGSDTSDASLADSAGEDTSTGDATADARDATASDATPDATDTSIADSDAQPDATLDASADAIADDAFDPPDANPQPTLTLVNAAGDTINLGVDVCIDRQGDAPAVTPHFYGIGWKGGVDLDQTSYPFAIQPGTYDFRFVIGTPYVATCANAKLLATVTNVVVTDPITIVFHQDATRAYGATVFTHKQFTGSSNTLATIHLSNAVPQGPAVDFAGKAGDAGLVPYDILIANVAPEQSSAYVTVSPSYQYFDTRSAGTTTVLDGQALQLYPGDLYEEYFVRRTSGFFGVLSCPPRPTVGVGQLTYSCFGG